MTVLVNSESEQRVEIGEAVVTALRSVGIDAQLKSLAWSAYVSALEKGDFDMYVAEARLQADFDVSALLCDGGALNYGNINDRDYRDLIDDFLAAEGEEKAQAAEKLCRYVRDTAPIVPLAFQRSSAVTHRGVVTGMSPSQSNVFRNITAWKIEL